MSEGFDQPQGGFRAPRVPFDLRCVLIAAAAFLAVSGMDWLLANMFNAEMPIKQLLYRLTGAGGLGMIPYVGEGLSGAVQRLWGQSEIAITLEGWQLAVTGICWIAVWSFFAGALFRTAALRLTRDEPISLKEALGFGAKNWFTFLLAPILVALFAGFFLLLNMAAGVLISIPLLGSWVLVLILFPLVLLSSLLIIVSLFGGLIGLPLMWAGIATEQNGALEALSRAFSYIFARPFRFFFGYFLLFILMAIVLLLAGHFEDTVKTSLQAGVWRTTLDDSISRAEPETEYFDLGKSERIKREKEGITNLKNIRDARWYDWLGFFWMWLWTNLFLYGFKGYALYVFLGGTASLYLHLRKDVDGTDEEDIYPESEEEWEAAHAEGTEPKWVSDENPDDAPTFGGDEPEPKPEPEPEA